MANSSSPIIALQIKKEPATSSALKELPSEKVDCKNRASAEDAEIAQDISTGEVFNEFGMTDLASYDKN